MASSTDSVHPPRIALVGYRGTGKTTVGKRLAQAMGWNFSDMDEMLVQRLGMTIRRWVERFGWESFRTAETALLTELAASPRMVLATGGGIIERPENRTILCSSFTVIWLRCGVKTIAARIAQDLRTSALRPSLTGRGIIEEIGEVVAARTPLYAETATITADTDYASPEEVCTAILHSLRRDDEKGALPPIIPSSHRP